MKRTIKDFIGGADGDLSAEIQRALDETAETGDILVLEAGCYQCAGLVLRRNTHLILEKGCVLKGDGDCSKYGPHQWYNAILYAENTENIHISGEGVIDGNNCVDPNGEEGFRGPHAICLRRCERICIEGVTVCNAANYAVLCTNSQNIGIRNLTVNGGHDGLHLQACKQIQVQGCTLRTGDDAVAGSDNQNAVFTGCTVNSSCHGFRFGGADVTVQECHIYGPGEYAHKISGRTNMISAFVYFAPKERECTQYGDGWLIRDVTVEGADALFCYDHECGIWQDGLPLRDIRFEHVYASGLIAPLQLAGDRDKLLQVKIEDMLLGFHGQFHIQDVLRISKIGSIHIQGLNLVCSEKIGEIQSDINQFKRGEKYA